MFVLVLATLAGGILTFVAAWPWFGLGSILLMPLGAGSAAAFMGLLLARLRRRDSSDGRTRPLGWQAEGPRASVNDDLPVQRRRA
ncbi:hypothetical protein [Methylobacterium sp. NEAU K]|uniref:hypothetical protein n=1 Tax=Methylobacterium sp. NEAU K TaxID=3064946 RepID=UPI002737567C|nr:hypothetical protein [Methylobacterium sp. NEAU K]MDP4004816.1 hypothetical protein [Methylobacterium sp. NEAU K]